MTDEPDTTGNDKTLQVVEKLSGFLNKLLGGAIDQLGGSLEDWASAYRYKNLLKIHDRLEAIHQQRRLDGKTKPIPPRYAIPLVQRASEEDDESIQEMWAALIANATDPTKHVDLNKMLLAAVAALEPLDVAILRFINQQGWLMHRNVPGGGIAVAQLTRQLNASEQGIRLSLQNLHRLGLIGDEFDMTYNSTSTTSFGLRVMHPETTFRLSAFGSALLDVCEE